jgi:hypothetical protein
MTLAKVSQLFLKPDAIMLVENYVAINIPAEPSQGFRKERYIDA